MNTENTTEFVYNEELEMRVPRKPSAHLTAEELVNEKSKWLPWLKCPLLRLAAAKGYRAAPDQSDNKEARWSRYVAAMLAIGLPADLAERFRRGPTDPECALRGLKQQWLCKNEQDITKVREEEHMKARAKQLERFLAIPLAAKFERPTLTEKGEIVWPGALIGRGHAPRMAAGGGFSYGVARCESTRRRMALVALDLVEIQEWRDCGVRGESSRAWTYEWTKNLTLEELETAAILLKR